MKIRLLSDIHQEFYEDLSLYTSRGEDVLVLAGDINVGFNRTLATVQRFAEQAKQVIFTPGNHEYYRQDRHQFDLYMRQFFHNTNVHFLNPGSVKISGALLEDSVSFIGACGWTNFRKDHMAQFACARSINDFGTIPGWTTDQCALLSTEHFKYIFEAYSAIPGKKVIVTHFLPATECIAQEYRATAAGRENLINYYFANDYGREIADMQNVTWLYGHSHSPMDFVIGDTRLINNAYGYNKNPQYVEKIIEV